MTTIIPWPASVPSCVMPMSPQGGLRDNRLSFETDDAVTPVERPRTSWAPELYQVTMVPMDRAMFEAFQAWFRGPLAYGSLPFVMDHPITREPTVWRIVKGDPPYQVSKVLAMRSADVRGISVSFGIQSLPMAAPDYPALLFQGRAGFWAGGFDPSAGRIRLSPGGAAASTFGQSAGQVIRAAGTVDAVQATAGARPTTSRWPVGGRRNTLMRTEELDHAYWNKARATVDANATADPLGAITADLLRETVGNGEHYADRTLTVAAGQVYTWSTYAKAFSSDREIALRTALAAGGNRIILNLQTGIAADIENSSILSWGRVDVGGGWYRLWTTATAVADGGGVFRGQLHRASDGRQSYEGNTSSGVYLWGAQLESGAALTPYQRVTTDRDVTETGVPDVWHLYNDGGDSLLAGAVPAGDYGLGWVDALGNVSFDTVTSNGTTPINVLRAEYQADVILRQGDFTADERLGLTRYWERLYK